VKWHIFVFPLVRLVRRQISCLEDLIGFGQIEKSTRRDRYDELLLDGNGMRSR
jgi:hypothetical protein